MPLSIDQTKQLYNALCQRIVELHNNEIKNNIIEFTKNAREKKWIGTVMINVTSIDELIFDIKNKKFDYTWMPKNKAIKIKHDGLRHALLNHNPKNECIITFSIMLEKNHMYINCFKILLE